MTPQLSEAAAALTQIMQLPDPPEIKGRRRHLIVCAGDSEHEAIKDYLRRCYEQHLLIAIESGDIEAPRLS